ncbi:hypothetical protein T06_6328, partial [Trichinella sp. T6]
LGPDESPDVFLAELRRLATLFGGVSEKALACAFVAGLPENVRQQLRVRSRIGYLGLSQILTRARAIITDERPVDAPNTCLSARGPGVQSPTAPPGQRCFECGRPNHFARDCLARRQGGDPAPLHIRETSSGQRHQRQPSVPATTDRGAARRPYERRWHTTPRAGRHGVHSVCSPSLVLPKLAKRGRRHHHDVWSGNGVRGHRRRAAKAPWERSNRV